MSITLGLRLTAAGETEMVAAVAEHRAFEISHMVLGDANGAWYEVTGQEEALLNECARIPLLSVAPHPEHSNRIVCDAPIPLDVGGFTIREFGLSSPEGVLLAMGMHQEIGLPDPGGPTIFDIVIRGMLDVLAIGVVSLVVDPLIVTATRSYVDTAVNNHNTPATEEAVGHVRLATAIETLEGLLNNTAVHPAALKAAMDALRDELAESIPEPDGNLAIHVELMALEEQLGHTQLATAAETLAGLLNNKAVHPAGLKTALENLYTLIMGGATPAVLDTIRELAAAFDDNPDVISEILIQLSAITTALGQKADSTAVSTHIAFVDPHPAIRGQRYYFSQI